MIILELTKEQNDFFHEILADEQLKIETITTQKLGGDEIIFQSLITLVSIAAPYIITLFKKEKSDNKNITIIKDGIKYTFSDFKNLVQFLEKEESEEKEEKNRRK